MILQEFNIEKPKVLPSEFLRIGWTTGRMAESDEVFEEDVEEYISVEPNSIKAVKWCAMGAFCASLDILSEWRFDEDYHDLYHFLAHYKLLRDLGFDLENDSITGYNDTMPFENVLEVVEAIELHLGWR